MEPIYIFNFLISAIAAVLGYFLVRLAAANYDESDGKLFAYGTMGGLLIIGAMVLWGNNFHWVFYI